MVKVRNKYNNVIVYFKFFASKEYPNCFWYTTIPESIGFELGAIKNFEPLDTSWEEIKNERF